MNKQDFNKVYNPYTRCIAYYNNGNEIDSGVLTDGVQNSTVGKSFVFINNHSNRVCLDDVIEVEDTGRKWAEQ